MTKQRDFYIGDILSITTGKLVSPRMMEGVSDILGYMVGRNLYTHQLPICAEECKPVLLEQHPQLGGVIVPNEFENESHIYSWLAEQEHYYGTHLSVKPIALKDRKPHNVIEDLYDMLADGREK